MPKRSPRRATISTVAQLAQVSTATVSRVLSGALPVNESTRERVLDAIEKLNYRPSELTRAVFAGRSNSIGLLLADMRNPYYIDLVDGVFQVATPAGALPYLALGNRDPETEQRMLELMDSHRVRGLISTMGPTGDPIVASMADAGTECVYMARPTEVHHPRVHTVRLNDLTAGRLAWRHLSELGRTDVLVVTQPEDAPTRRDRLSGFFAAALEDGYRLDENSIFHLDSLQSPNLELQEHINRRVRNGEITAVFATTGIATAITYEALSTTGLLIPGEVAMLGFDEFAWAGYLSPAISVIVQPAVEMGRAAAQLILDEPGESVHLRFEPSLIPRASTVGA